MWSLRSRTLAWHPPELLAKVVEPFFDKACRQGNGTWIEHRLRIYQAVRWHAQLHSGSTRARQSNYGCRELNAMLFLLKQSSLQAEFS